MFHTLSLTQRIGLCEHISSGMENTLADLQMLSESFKRMKDPARYKDEAKAVLSMGVIYDNRMVCVISLPSLNECSF